MPILPSQSTGYGNRYNGTANSLRLRLMQWIRLEEKFKHKILNNDALADGYQFNWKLRYNFLFNVPLNRKAFAPGTLSFVLNDELHVNFGSEIVYNYFDQNRFFAGFSFHTMHPTTCSLAI
jgi:hypothetical protein